MHEQTRTNVWPLLLLPILALIAYANSLHGVFVFDDQAVIFQNAKTMNTATLRDVIALGRDYCELLFVTKTISRNTVWSSSISRWEGAESKAPAKWRPHVNLGEVYQETQRIPEAIREYEHALAIKPDAAAVLSNLAGIYSPYIGPIRERLDFLLRR